MALAAMSDPSPARRPRGAPALGGSDGILSAFLFADWLGKPVWLWLAFHALVLVLLAFDLGVLHRDSEKEIGVRQSLALSAFYITLGVLFGGFVWWMIGPQARRNT